MSNPYSTGTWMPNLSGTFDNLANNLVNLKTHSDAIDMQGRQLAETTRQHNVASFGTETPTPGMPTLAQQTVDQSKEHNGILGIQADTDAKKTAAEIAKLGAQFTPYTAASVIGRMKSTGLDKALQPEIDQISEYGKDPQYTFGTAHDDFVSNWQQKRADILNRLQDDVSGKIAKDPNFPNTPEGKKAEALMNGVYADESGEGVADLIFPGVGRAKMLAEEVNKNRYIPTDQGLFDTATRSIIPGTAKIKDQAHNVIEVTNPDGKTARKLQYNPDTQQYDKPVGSPYLVKSQVPKVEVSINSGAAGPGMITPTAPGETNSGALQGLTPVQQQTVKAIAEYRFPVTNLRNKEMMALVQRAYAYDPTFDAKEYAVRSAVRRDFTSGTSSKTALSLNTSIGHLESLAKAAEGLENSNVQSWNTFRNALTTKMSNDPRVTRFNTTANAVAGELATVFKSTSGTDQEIKSWREQLSTSMTPAQLKVGAVDQSIELIGSRLAALREKYETGIGRPMDFNILSSKSRKILKGLGVDVDKFDPIVGKPQASGAAPRQIVSPTVPRKIGRFTVEVE